jgi:predicted SAM-dependent methyltransferase
VCENPKTSDPSPLKSWVRRHTLLIASLRGVRSASWAVLRNVRRPLRPLELGNYLRIHDIRKLHVGAGAIALGGWLNTELVPTSLSTVHQDITKRFPFEAGTFHYIYNEHVIEHLSQDDGTFVLREFFRVLRPGGRVRIATPDLRVILGLFGMERTPEQDRYIRTVTDKWLPHAGTYHPCFVLNNMMRNWGHQFVYDRDTLQRAVEACGFRDVRFFAPRESDDAHLRGLEARADEEDNRFETMILEASKPTEDGS